MAVSSAADVTDDRILLLHLFQLPAEISADHRRVARQVVLVEWSPLLRQRSRQLVEVIADLAENQPLPVPPTYLHC